MKVNRQRRGRVGAGGILEEEEVGRGVGKD